ncbi:MAG: putative nucleotide-diphospho-sugar transferase [Smithella sp.]
MKVFGVYSEENKKLKDDWFLKTLADDFELNFKYLGSSGGQNVHFASEYWFSAIRERHEYLCQAIRDHFGEIILSVDFDIQFFGQCLPVITQAIAGKDIVFQSEYWPPTGDVNAGFVAIRCNDKTLDFYNRVARMEFEKMRYGDQSAMNMLLRDKANNLEWGVFPAQIWAKSQGNFPPGDILVHHANCTASMEDKVKQLKLIRGMVLAKPGYPFWIYKKYLILKRKISILINAVKSRIFKVQHLTIKEVA